MNLAKISSQLNKYIDSIKDEKIPDVFELYNMFGASVMGRRIYKNMKIERCFNKSIVHKMFPHYIGKPRKGFYQQDILSDIREIRCFCVNGMADRFQEIADLVIDNFNINNFVFDVFYTEDRDKIYLMELNEIHLSTIEKEDLDYIYSQILI